MKLFLQTSFGNGHKALTLPHNFLAARSSMKFRDCDSYPVNITVQSTIPLISSGTCETYPQSSCLGSVILSASVCPSLPLSLSLLPHLPCTPRLPQNYHDLLYVSLEEFSILSSCNLSPTVLSASIVSSVHVPYLDEHLRGCMRVIS
jgi:hypothetical protein